MSVNKREVQVMDNLVTADDIREASKTVQEAAIHSPLLKDEVLSRRYDCNVYLKREDLQPVRSFKIRGAYNLIKNLSETDREKGVVCASAGNHAQGVAMSCQKLGIKGKIFMPTTTPRQKISQVAFFGGMWVDIVITGDSFDDSYKEAHKVCEEEGMTFVHPFDDKRTIAGQGTVGKEIMDDMDEPISHIFMSVGGGGLSSGVGTYVKDQSPDTKIIGVEPAGAASMKTSLEKGEVVTLEAINKFVDGASVARVGDITFRIAQKIMSDVVSVPEGKVCTTILNLYNENAIIAEPAGAMPVAALDFYREEIKGKNIVCVISGGNNDISRMQEMKERSLIYEGLKHYFIVNFPQRAGALREFMLNVLGETDDITRFEYTKKNNREKGPVLVGIELKQYDDYYGLVHRMEENGFTYTELNKDQELFNLLV
ncbi:threonine ammonia-lyase IlvA [Salimicrobium flavidum]|uniref:L-threonine dehydratase n=1 Tax=Salimicrobium flavidum TaxID=570947 RepID=A0A1N7IRN2_9BACI|nr:L-threonine ammonia-lyase [Salimicrobium flavidum]